jgi:hypothetical protein
MTPDNVKKLKDAFNAAVDASPYADEIVEGMATRDGKDVTRRMLVDLVLKSDEFYKQLDKALDSGKVTLDEFISKFETGMKRSNKSGPRP